MSRSLLLASLLALSVELPACPLSASTELEQLYCQLQAKGATLPAARDFKANNPQIQALLLKRPAERYGLSLPAAVAPVKRVDTAAPVAEPEPSPAAPARIQSAPPMPAAALRSEPVITMPGHGCQWQAPYLHCRGGRYQALGNQANSRLKAQALSAGNTLGLQPYQGQSVADYLPHQYETYLQGMIRIGLAGSILSFDSFQTIFEQNRQQGLAFDQRFETMYGYLKQEKRRNDGGRAAAIAGLQPQGCRLWGERLATCPAQRNLLLQRID